MQVLEHEQHGCGGCSVGEQRERLLEHPQLRAGRRFVDLPRLPERTQGLDERLVRQLCADEIDRAPEQDLEPGGAGASRELGREPGLADARFSGDEDGRTAPGPRRGERALELPELAYASDEDVARASLHPASIAHSHPQLVGRRKDPTYRRYATRGQKIKRSARCAPARRRRRSGRSDEHELLAAHPGLDATLPRRSTMTRRHTTRCRVS